MLPVPFTEPLDCRFLPFGEAPIAVRVGLGDESLEPLASPRIFEWLCRLRLPPGRTCRPEGSVLVSASGTAGLEERRRLVPTMPDSSGVVLWYVRLVVSSVVVDMALSIRLGTGAERTVLVDGCGCGVTGWSVVTGEVLCVVLSARTKKNVKGQPASPRSRRGDPR